MSWYDFFSNFYDGSLEKLYGSFRHVAAQRLELSEGMRVLDAGCGTGQSFDLLSAGVGASGAVVGVDLSTGMLKRAAKRIEGKELKNTQVVQGSLFELDPETVEVEGFDRALCFLVLSALDAWPDAFEAVWSRVKPGGKLVIVDTHAEKLGFQGRMVNLTARADIRRQVWGKLEEVAEGFTLERLDADWRVGGDIIVASGFKRA